MKKLILILTLFSTAACAEPVAYCYNEGGGKIVLTDAVCDGKPGQIAYSTFADAKVDTLTGCWLHDSVAIHILWTGRGLRSYDYSGWVLIKKDRKTSI